ncbi:MAG: FAD-dependent oxidoreductase [Candidatus Omnitrophica bacterium]|nr:FAD-dependent oxidoreductase [Candidatus Omnitrophota bacterium]
MKQSLAVIGTGIAGMGAAYFLRDRFDISFFEKNDYPGGHTHTLTIKEGDKDVYIDSGFMVYNEKTYPNLTRLFKELDVTTKPTSMSFSVQHIPSGLEYCGTGYAGLFAQPQNLFKSWFWKMLIEIESFRKHSVEVLDNDQFTNHTIKEYVYSQGYSVHFLEKFLIPMSSAVWSTPADLMYNFPVVTLVRFFKNHGFLGLHTQLPWRTVTNGSRVYRDKILAMFPQSVQLSNAAVRIYYERDKVIVLDQTGKKNAFDRVVIATHADEALALLGDPTPQEASWLGAFRYQYNLATLHTDEAVMPKKRKAWSSWNYRIHQDADGRFFPSTVYDMNSLQQVSDKRNYFISINGEGTFDNAKVLWQGKYTHPIYDSRAIRAQKDLPLLNQNRRRYFCGSYFRYGFHEDALSSALDVARLITGERIWAD